MRSSNSAKVLIVIFCTLLLLPACRFWQKTESETPSPFVAEEMKTDVPFSTTEPENFQAEFVVTVNAQEDKTLIARAGGRQFSAYNFGKNNQFSNMRTADGKSFQVVTDKKIYVENSGIAPGQPGDNPFDFLTAEWLSQKTAAKFERLGAENGLIKYRAVLGENGKSEVEIWVDEQIGLPVKQEFYSLDGNGRTLNLTFEMKNFTAQVNENFFEIPKDFRKVTIEEFRRILHSEN